MRFAGIVGFHIRVGSILKNTPTLPLCRVSVKSHVDPPGPGRRSPTDDTDVRFLLFSPVRFRRTIVRARVTARRCRIILLE